MKKLLLSLVLAGLLIPSSAADYKYLTLENSDGSKVSLAASGLTLTFSDGNLVANDGTTLPLSSLAKMYFTETSGITTVTGSTSSVMKAYTLSGVLAGTYAENQDISLPKGIYIIKDQQGNTHKITIR